MIPGSANPLLLTSADSGYAIERSLRFNSGDSAYLNRTPSAAGNRKTWTWSGWVKKARVGEEGNLFTVGASSTDAKFRFNGNDTLEVSDGGGGQLTTAAVFRDTSAWYHIVVLLDNTQATAANRFKLYINGSEAVVTGSPSSQNTDGAFNTAVAHYIGRQVHNTANLFNGYLAEINFIDGSALDPTSFGAFDNNGVWQPKKFAGTYGTNGFHLPFTDNSSNAALGTDTSSNNNTWTVNNLVATSGFETANQGFDCRANLTGQFTVNNLNFQPDLIVAKSTSNSEYWIWTDSVRGFDKVLKSNTTDAENSSAAAVTGVGSSGFSSSSNWFTTGRTYSTWCWKAGVAASSNTDGTITTSVSANTSYGFSITSYVGNQTSGATIGHGLNSEPKFAIIKSRDTALDWIVYHASTGNTGALRLNTTQAVEVDSKWFNNAGPSSSTFTLGNTTGTNKTGDNMIAYMWSEVPGFSKFSSYSGNGSTTGPVITTGFKPKFVMVKASSIAGEDWVFMDTARAPSNPSTYLLSPNIADTQYNSSVYSVDFLDNGFQIKNNNPRWNQNGATYIYAAFADKPDGSAIDSLIDTPTDIDANSGNNPGNYATLNPLDKSSSLTLSNGNLEADTTGGWDSVRATFGMSSGKWYWETQNKQTAGALIGIALSTAAHGALGTAADGAWTWAGANVYINGTSSGTGLSNHSSTDIVQYALDVDAGKLWFGRNGTWYDSSWGTTGNPSTGANPTVSGLSTTSTYFAAAALVGAGAIYNFGQRAFAYAAPSGYKALCTANLPTPTIADGSKYFDTKLYTGNGGTNAQTGLGFSPDFLWLKRRNGANAHALFDEIRGVTKALESSNTGAEKTNDPAIGSFDSNGFTLTGSTNQTNASGQTYVGWAWDGGTSTVTNNDGSIASQVRANPSAGFSIVSYDYPASGSFTVGHGLNAAPAVIIYKNRNRATSWFVYHSAATSKDQYLILNGTNAVTAGTNFWGANAPTNAVFGSTVGVTGISTDESIAYCFAPVEGYSAMGSYTGNGSTDGPFVALSFRPAVIILKRTDSSSSWQIRDTTRSPHNVVTENLYPNLSNAESTDSSLNLDILSNGFKPRTSTDGGSNASGGTYVYIAFASNPFQANGGLAR